MDNIRMNTSAINIQRTLVMQQICRREQLQEEMARHFWPVIGTANQVAYMAIDDAVEAMRERGMLRHNEKRHAQMAVEEYHRYERAAYEHFAATGDDRYTLWQDLIGRAAERLQADVQRLFFAAKNVLDREGVKDSDVMAYIQTALALVTLSTLLYDTLLKEYQRQTMLPMGDMFAGGRLTGVERHWMSVGEITGRRVMKTVNLRDDEACQTGVRVILNRYQQADFLQEAAREALELNPSAMRYINDNEE